MIHESRVVSKDNIVSFDGVAYEVPRGHRGDTVVLHRHLLCETIAMVHEGRLVELAPVDLEANATSGRIRSGQEPEACDDHRPLSAAELAFRQDMEPIVGLDGGFTDSVSQED